MKRSWIEKFAEGIRLIPRISQHEDASEAYALEGPRPLYKYPKPEEWDNFVELDPQAWPVKKERRYSIVPTTCFNCESACGLLAYIDKGDDKSANSRETLIIQARVEEIAPKVQPPSIRSRTPNAFFIPSSEWVNVELVTGNRSPGIRLLMKSVPKSKNL